MNKQFHPLTVALTGQLSIVLTVAAVLALAASLLLLWRYRRAVIKSMRRRSRSEIAMPTGYLPPEEPHKPPETAAVFTFVDTEALDRTALKRTVLYRQIRRRPWIAATIYAVAGLGFAATMTGAFLLSSKMPFLPLRFLYFTWANAWPAVLTTNLVATVTGRARTVVLAAYLLAGVALGILLLRRSPDLTVLQLAYLWFDANLIPSLLLLFFLHRRIRAVGPLVLIFMIVGAAGAMLVVSVTGNNPKLLRAVSNFTYSLGLSAAGTVWGLHLLGFALSALLSWVVLDSLRQMYERKYLSELSVSVDAVWLTFGIVNSMGFVFQGASWIASGPVAFAIFKILAALGFAFLRRRRNPNPLRLLLLRVFALGSRSERLYDAVGKHWRTAGSIQMIAGPDLATSTVEPHEFLDFVTGKIARRFIDSGQTLDLRIEQMDLRADSDARFRVTEFFCHDDTWKVTLSRLADESDAVLMDLRSFSRSNAGCIFEINELFNVVPLRRIVFVIDDSTDQQFMRETMQAAWREIKERSPNRRGGAGHVSLVHLSRLNGNELRNLLYAIGSAASTEPVEAVRSFRR
jgi:hypothetical protein